MIVCSWAPTWRLTDCHRSGISIYDICSNKIPISTLCSFKTRETTQVPYHSINILPSPVSKMQQKGLWFHINLLKMWLLRRDVTHFFFLHFANQQVTWTYRCGFTVCLKPPVRKINTWNVQFEPFIQVYHSSLFEKYSKCFISNITYTNVTIANRCVKIHKTNRNWQKLWKKVSTKATVEKIGKNKVIQDRTNPFLLHTGLRSLNYQTKIGC